MVLRPTRGTMKMAKKKKRDQHDVLNSRSLAARISKAKQFDAGSPLLFSVPEAAAKLRIGLSKMWQMVWQEEIPRIIIGRQTRIRAQDVYDYLKIREPPRSQIASSPPPAPPPPPRQVVVGKDNERLIKRLDAVSDRLDAVSDRLDLVLYTLAAIGAAAAEAVIKRKIGTSGQVQMTKPNYRTPSRRRNSM